MDIDYLCYEAFEYALLKDDDRMVDYLLSQGINVNAKCRNSLDSWYKKGDTFFEKMLYDNKPKYAEKLLAHGALIEKTGKKAWEILKYALHKEYLVLADLLISAGIDANIKDEYNRSLFYWEAWDGHEQGARLLLSKGFDISSINAEDLNFLLSRAVKGWHVGILKVLVENGADINYITNDGENLLEIACIRDYPYFAELLISKGADVNLKSKEGKTPLMIAVENKNDRIIELLIMHGADFYKNQGSKLTLLHDAVWEGWSGVILALNSIGFDINHGINDKHVPENNSTALTLAASWGRKKVVQTLISCGADVNAKGLNGTPLLCAIKGTKKDDCEIAEIIIAAGADINSESDEIDMTPIMEACRSGYIKIVEFLVSKGAYVTTQDRNGNSPLHHLSFKTMEEIITERFVTETKDDYDIRIAEGGAERFNTRLEERLLGYERQAKDNKIPIARILIKNGADVNSKNNDGENPCQFALKNKQESLAGFFKEIT